MIELVYVLPAHNEEAVLAKNDVPPLRRVTTFVYRWMRRGVIGVRVRDSQGSVVVRLGLAKIVSGGFFYSTELCRFAERAGVELRTEMASQLFALRRRARSGS